MRQVDCIGGLMSCYVPNWFPPNASKERKVIVPPEQFVVIVIRVVFRAKGHCQKSLCKKLAGRGVDAESVKTGSKMRACKVGQRKPASIRVRAANRRLEPDVPAPSGVAAFVPRAFPFCILSPERQLLLHQATRFPTLSKPKFNISFRSTKFHLGLSGNWCRATSSPLPT